MKQKIVLCTTVLATALLTACSSGGGKGGMKAVSIPVVSKENTITTMSPVVASQTGGVSQVQGVVKSNTIKVNGTEVKDGKLDLAQYGQGNKELSFTQNSVVTENGKDKKIDATGKVYLFQQNYSAMAVIERENIVVDGQKQNVKDGLSKIIVGQATKTLPTAGTYNYAGDVKLYGEDNKELKGKLTYAIDFAQATGQGKIAGIEGADITLAKATIRKDMALPNDIDNVKRTAHSLFGSATYKDMKGHYGLGIFGPNADEVIGEVSVGKHGAIEGPIGGKKQ